MEFFYIYVLQSTMDKNFFVGYTNDIKRRLDKHNSGQVDSTKYRKPLKLIYWEGCLNRNDAISREKYLKTAWGKRYMKNRLRNYLTGQVPQR